MAHVLLLPLQSTRRTDTLNLSLVNPAILLHGFQLYAVEKWLVDRSRPLTLLTVYTGHQDHILPVAAYTTNDTSSWDKIISFLKRDGARQRQTEHGYIMVTSLAHFRSDYTIVHIPDGDFPAYQDHLYTNINLLRMNCAGRSALTLEEPSDSTKDRFASTYLIPDVSLPNSRTRDRNIFTATVLELVKLIQAGLSLFGMHPGVLDGLLCDTTVDGIRRWIADIGEPIIGLEPTERIADPMFVSALLSFVLSIRNKLSALGYGQHVPKDPFLQPQILLNALAIFVHNTSPFMPTSLSNSSNTPAPSAQGHSLTHAHSFSLPNSPLQAALAYPLPIVSRIVVLNQPLIEAIDNAYDSKHRPTESRKVRRAIKEKLDDLAGVVAGTTPDINQSQSAVDISRRATQSSLDIPGPGDWSGSANLVGNSTTLGGFASGLGLGSGTNGLPSMTEPTVQLSRLVKLALSASPSSGWTRGKSKSGKQRESVYAYGKDGGKDKEAGIGASVRALWGGHVDQLIKMREWQELAAIDDKEPHYTARQRYMTGTLSEGEDLDRAKPDGRTTEEESDQVLGGPSFWGERMQRTLESLTSRRGRRRPPGTLDLAISPSKNGSNMRLSTTRKGVVASSPLNPLLQAPHITSPSSPLGSDDDDLLSGQVSPRVSSSPAASREPSRLRTGKYEPFLSPQFWAPTKKLREPGRLSAPITRDDLSDLSHALEGTLDLPYSVTRDDNFIDKQKKASTIEQRRSFHDLRSLHDMLVLTPEQMRIDVELCGQLLVMARRQEHLHNIVASLQMLESSLSVANSFLRADYESHLELIASLESTSVFADVSGEYKEAEKISQQAKTLMYESEQFDLTDLGHAAKDSRQKVLEFRHKVFGADGRRLPHGVHGAHGPYNRLQWTLDGKPRLVDTYGRTEKEAEEEKRADPSGVFSPPVPEEDEDVVEHPGMKPMWLLRLFNRWGARWGAHPTVPQSEQQPTSTDMATSSALESKSDSIVAVSRTSPANTSTD